MKRRLKRWKQFLLPATGIIFGGILLFILEETIRLKNTGFETKTLWKRFPHWQYEHLRYSASAWLDCCILPHPKPIERRVVGFERGPIVPPVMHRFKAQPPEGAIPGGWLQTKERMHLVYSSPCALHLAGT